MRINLCRTAEELDRGPDAGFVIFRTYNLTGASDESRVPLFKVTISAHFYTGVPPVSVRSARLPARPHPNAAGRADRRMLPVCPPASPDPSKGSIALAPRCGYPKVRMNAGIPAIVHPDHHEVESIHEDHHHDVLHHKGNHHEENHHEGETP